MAGDLGLYASLEWLRATSEFSRPVSAGEPECLWARDARGQGLGVAPVHILTSSTHPLYDPYLLSGGLAAAGDPTDCVPFAVVGPPTGYGNEPSIDPLLPTGDRAHIYRELLAAAERQARARGARVLLVPCMTQPGLGLLNRVAGPGWPSVLGGAEVVMDVSWRSFDEYIAWLPTSRRRTVRREVDAFRGSGVRITRGTLAEYASHLPPLLFSVHRRYDPGATLDVAALALDCLRRHLSDHSVVFMCWAAGRPVGFSLFFVWNRRLYARFCGLDHDRLSGAGEYFQLLFYEPIRYAIATGLEAIHLGIGAKQPKLFRGATLRPLWSLVAPLTARPRGFVGSLRTLSRTRHAEWLQSWGSLSVDTRDWVASLRDAPAA